ncbi:DUF3885 domain-containing protein [Aquisphaera giovannonii]|nr:hypothetical protein [Aquisphaera giovannonii]
MKFAFPERWVRFHSLPGSKRYPEDESEYAIALGRQNRVLDELIGRGGRVVLLTTEYSDSEASPSDRPATGEVDPLGRPWQSFLMHETDQDPTGPTFWHIFASEWMWSPGILDPILRLVADDVIRNVMIVHPECAWLFHPYDGGMDLILESSAVRDLIRASHPDWLSSRPDGL